jgi:hypothetical protein
MKRYEFYVTVSTKTKTLEHRLTYYARNKSEAKKRYQNGLPNKETRKQRGVKSIKLVSVTEKESK